MAHPFRVALHRNATTLPAVRRYLRRGLAETRDKMSARASLNHRARRDHRLHYRVTIYKQ